MPTVKKNVVVRPGQVSYSLVKAVAHSERQHATTAAEKFKCKCDTLFSFVDVFDVVVIIKKSNDLSDTITRQQLRGHLTKKDR